MGIKGFRIDTWNFHSCGVGGGSFMMINDEKNNVRKFINCREKAPSGAHEGIIICFFLNKCIIINIVYNFSILFKEMYVEGTGNSPTTGAMAIGVPGEMACLAHAHENYGHLPWEDLMMEIAEFTENGVFVTSTNEGALQENFKT